MITTVLLDLDDTILADDFATEQAFAATAKQAEATAGVDPVALIAAVRAESKRLWDAGPFPDWLDGIGTSEIEGLRARFEGDDPHWETMREWGPGFRRESWERALESLGAGEPALAIELDETFERERISIKIDGGLLIVVLHTRIVPRFGGLGMTRYEAAL